MIQSVLKAIDLMGVFTPQEPCLPLSEIAARADMPKSTTHNLLATLASRGLVEKLDNDSYALGTAIISFTQAARVNAELRDRAAPLLREFADVVHESVYLTYLDGDYALYIYAIETSHRLMARTAVGDRVHLHCTGVGKAILAELPRDHVEDLIARTGLPGFTPHTLVDPDSLFEELARTHNRGYSIDNQEHETGTYCIGVVIRDAHGKPIGACSVSGRDPEIIHSRADGVVSDLLYTAQEISRRMGYIPAKSALIMPRADRVKHHDM